MGVRHTMLVLATGACLMATLGCGTPASPRPDTGAPPIFAPARIHDAIREAGTDRLVVVDFTATWCGPCKLMERTVWTDPRITDWMERGRAVFVRSDADANTDERDAYGVSAWPTVIVLRRGEVIERRLGYQGVEQLLGLLSRAATGAPPPGAFEVKVRPAN